MNSFQAAPSLMCNQCFCPGFSIRRCNTKPPENPPHLTCNGLGPNLLGEHSTTHNAPVINQTETRVHWPQAPPPPPAETELGRHIAVGPSWALKVSVRVGPGGGWVGVTGWRAKLCYLLRSRIVMLHPAKKKEKKKVDFGGSGGVGTKNDGVAGNKKFQKGWCQKEG